MQKEQSKHSFIRNVFSSVLCNVPSFCPPADLYTRQKTFCIQIAKSLAKSTSDDQAVQTLRERVSPKDSKIGKFISNSFEFFGFFELLSSSFEFFEIR